METALVPRRFWLCPHIRSKLGGLGVFRGAGGEIRGAAGVCTATFGASACITCPTVPVWARFPGVLVSCVVAGVGLIVRVLRAGPPRA